MTNTKGFLTLIFLLSLLSCFILNFISYSKSGKRGYVNKYLHLTMAVSFGFYMFTQILANIVNFNSSIADVKFYQSALVSMIPETIFLGGLLFTGIVEFEHGSDLEKSVKDEMGQEVTQEKILLDQYPEYFTYKLLADIFLFVMFLFIVAFVFASRNLIPAIYEQRESIKHWGVYTSYTVFTILFFVFQGLRKDILVNFLTDG